ncbi:MAG: ABC transporter substrate-binding protein [Geminicoccaceae bacterium]
MQRKGASLLVGAAIALGICGPVAAQSTSPAEQAVAEARQYAGTTLTITWEAGLQALDPLNFSGPLWEELTGISINVVEIPFDEMFVKTMAEFRAGTGAYDVLNVVPSQMPDLVSAGVIEPLDDDIDKYGFREHLQTIAPVYRDNWMTVNDVTYGLPDDGDVFILYYRKDLFEDPDNQAAFREKYGYDLAPPATWQQFDEIAEFFTDEYAPDLYGTAMIRGAGLVEPFFQERFRNEGGAFLDAATMRATINSEVGVKVLADTVREHQWMPPGAETWGFVEVLAAWLSGDVAMTISWPPFGRWSAGYGAEEEALSWVPKSEIAGKVGYALPPGGHPELANGFALGISSQSRNKEAAYLFIQWMNSPEISLQRVQLPYALRDPFRQNHFTSAEYQSRWPAAPAYLATLEQAAKTGILDLSILQTAAYVEALGRAIQAAIAGVDPQDALDQAAAEWDALTERIGIDAQRSAYLDWASKPNAYPQ